MIRNIFIIVLLLFSFSAKAAVVFAWRSDQLNARYCGSGGCTGQVHYQTTSGDTAPAITTNNTSGVYGGSDLPFNAGTTNLAKGIWFPANGNIPNTDTITWLFRIIPTQSSGSLTWTSALFFSGIYDLSYWRIEMLTNSTLQITLKNTPTGLGATNINSSAFTLVANTPTDIQITYDRGANPKFSFYQDGVAKGTANPTVTNSWSSYYSKHGHMTVGERPDQPNALQNYHLNEMVIYNTAEAAITRSAFISVSAVDGSSYSDPGIANVRSSTSYTYAGASQTGTAAIPAAADVRSGTSVGATTGSLAVPSAANVKTGISVDATTGTLTCTDPGIANVRSGTTYTNYSSSLTGTAAIPTAADVRSGTSVGATTGSLAVPSAANVKTGISVDATTGTLVCTDPGQTNVRSATGYTIYSVSKTGSAAIPAAADVRSGTSVDATTGTLNLATAANIKHGVTQDNGAITGTYRGADLWTSLSAGSILLGATQTQDGSTVTGTLESVDPGVANVKLGTSYKINSAPLFGQNDPGNTISPGVANVRSGTLFQLDGTLFSGTMDLPAVSNVKSGVTFDNATKTGTLVSTDPGISHVASGVTYTINGVGKVGTLTTGTTIISGPMTLDSQVPASSSQSITKGDGPYRLRMTLKGGGTAVSVAGATFTTWFQMQNGRWFSIADDQHIVIESGSSNVGVVDVQITAAQTAKMKSGLAVKYFVEATISGAKSSFWGTLKEIKNSPAQ